MNALARLQRQSWAARWALRGLLSMMLVALLAPLLASDLPLAVALDERTWWLPCLTHPAELRGETHETLRPKARWMVPTPVPHGPAESLLTQSSEVPPWAPARQWPLGTDEIGRDVLARLIHGARTSLFIALLTVALAVLAGSLLGALGARLGGLVDSLVLRAIEVTTALPGALVLIAAMGVTHSQSGVMLACLIAALRWPEVARVTRAEVLRLNQSGFVIAARQYGASPLRIIIRHLLPNAAGPLLVVAVSLLASTLLLESALSFLGLGPAAPTATWGELLAQAHRTLVTPGAWWLALFPGMALGATVLCAHVIAAEALRAFDAGREGGTLQSDGTDSSGGPAGQGAGHQ